MFVLYWLIFVPKGSLRWRAPFVWLIFPAAYLVFALWRGETSGFWAYPFIDATAIGYRQVAINAAGMLGLFLGFGLIFVLLDRALARFSRPVDPGPAPA